MLSVARLVNFWRCIPMQYNCQKSSNFQGLSHFSRIFGKNDKIPGFFQAGKTVTIFPGFPGAVGTLWEGGKEIEYITADATSIGGATYPFKYISFKMLQFAGRWAPHSNDHSLK